MSFLEPMDWTFLVLITNVAHLDCVRRQIIWDR